MTTDDKPPVTLTPEARVAYVAAFEAITDGRNRDAAMALRGLDDAQLEELAVICGDVRTMAEAALRISAGSLGTPAARRIRARADRKAVAEALRRAGIGEPADPLGRLEDVDRAVTPEHVAERYRELLEDTGTEEAPEGEK